MEENIKKPRKSKKDSIIKTPFGLVYKNSSSEEKAALNQILFSATDPSEHGHLPKSVFQDNLTQGRQLPRNDIKADHLFIRGINLTKNLSTGNWEISLVETNQGRFAVSEEQNNRIDQQEIRKVVNHLKAEVFEEDLKAFLEGEKE